jgi:type II secretory pathway component PulK
MSFCQNIKPCIKNRNVNGTVLIVTIWIVLALAGLVLVFARYIRVEAIASANYVASVQAEAAAYGAVQFIIAQLNSDEESSTLESENPYEQMQVGEGYFWLLRSNLADDTSYDFGITDESSKINLNLAPSEMLLKLPGMTAELAAAIIDWRDEDSEIWPGGAESEYYLLLDEPYYCKNSPLETVEEVLLLRGASPEILYGEDMNRNGVLNYNENDAAESEPADNRDGRLDRGFYDYVTVYSSEENVSQSGEERINVNGGSELSELIRQVVTDDRYYQIMENIRSVRQYENILQFYFVSGLTYDEFEQIADRLTTTDEQYITGRVNVNLAPREVLLCLPGLVESDVDALIDKRTSSDVNLESIAWVAEALEPEKAVAIGSYITVAASSRYSADIISTSGNGRAYRRYRVVLDMQNEPPSIIYWKELTYLGWPLDTEIISTLRSGL